MEQFEDKLHQDLQQPSITADDMKEKKRLKEFLEFDS